MTSALAKQVKAANRRAQSMRGAGTLTTLDWRRTLEAFGGCCAYRGAHTPLTIDHFIPLATWGGTTSWSNCVPSCLACNRLKADQYPDEQPLTFVAPERLEKIRTYLQEIGRWRQSAGRQEANLEARSCFVHSFLQIPFLEKRGISHRYLRKEMTGHSSE